MNNVTNWYIFKTKNQQCEIAQLAPNQAAKNENYWGPFSSKEEAVVRRVGLIRAGKCKPQL